MAKTTVEEVLGQKLDNIISGNGINEDDAAWLRALLSNYGSAMDTLAEIKHEIHELRIDLAEEQARWQRRNW